MRKLRPSARRFPALRPSALRAAAALTIGLCALGTLAAAPSSAADLGSTLGPGKVLRNGDLLTSPNRQHHLTVDPVFAEWESLTLWGDSCDVDPILDKGHGFSENRQLIMQTDGNLVQTINGRIVWNARTQGNPGARLVLQGDRNVVVYSATGRALWASGTVCDEQANTVPESDEVMNRPLVAGQFMQSGNRRYRLIMQTDGNLVLYSPGRAIWSSRSNGNPGAYFVHQSDNNLVVYSAAGRALWNSGARSGYWSLLVLQDDGNLVKMGFDGNRLRPTWSTGTAGRS